MKDMGKMLKQAHEMKKKMKEVQDSLSKETVEARTVGGRIYLCMTGEMNVVDVKVHKELLEDGHQKRLQEGLKEAFNEATLKAKKIATDRLTAVTGGLKLPGM